MVKEMPASCNRRQMQRGVVDPPVRRQSRRISSDLRSHLARQRRPLQDLHTTARLSAIRARSVDSRTIEAFGMSSPSLPNHRHGIGGELPAHAPIVAEHVRLDAVSVA